MLSSSLLPRASRTALADKAEQIRGRFGPNLGWREVQVLLTDRSIVPVPCDVMFESEQLLAGEFGHTTNKGPAVADGYIICIHPVYADQPEALTFLVLQQLAFVLAGRAAGAEDAEFFGAECLGLSRDEYYARLCELATQAGGDDLC